MPITTLQGQPLPSHMDAMLTLGQGGTEQLAWRQLPLPLPRPGELLLRVLAAGINPTDINTRVGWYGAGWSGATPFPLIQGADCCGQVVAVADAADRPRLGQRVLVRSCMRVAGFADPRTRWLGTDCNGAFAQYVAVPTSEAFAVQSDWSDAELAALPCAWGTAENMLHRAGLTAGEQVWVAGASGGVGSAVVQLARRRGAVVTALTRRSKQAEVALGGADRVVCAEDDPAALAALPPPDLVVDNVAGTGFGPLLAALRRGGRYVTSGAIAGAEVPLDLRSLYLRDITLIGCTAWDAAVFPQLLGYVERNEVRPRIAGTFALRDLPEAQQAFLAQARVGKWVLLP